MKFEKTKRLLQREIRISEKMYRCLRRLAKKSGAEFVRLDDQCWFEVEGKRGPKDVERKKEKILTALINEGIGDERGVFSGSPWFEVKIEFGGLTLERIREAIEERRFIKLSMSETTDGVTKLWHRDNLNTPIELRELEDGLLRLTYVCETLSDMRMLTSHFCGGLTYHFWDTIEQIRVDHQELEYDW